MMENLTLYFGLLIATALFIGWRIVDKLMGIEHEFRKLNALLRVAKDNEERDDG